MKHIIFVHGTGVRKPSYDESYSQVVSQLYSKDMEVLRCSWGEVCGVTLKSGISIPEFDTARSINDINPGDIDVSIWGVLYDDPLFELRLLGMLPKDSVNARPDQRTALQEMKTLLNRLAIDGSLAAPLANCRVIQVWAEAMQKVTASTEYAQALQSTNGINTELRYILARAFVAQALALRAAEFDGEVEWVTGRVRNQLVEALVNEFGGKDRFGGEWALKNLLARPLTRYAKSRRGRLSEKSFAAAGDILFYQTRGKVIRDFIRDKIEKYDSEVILLTHSLGGIASVDLLIETPLPQVEMLVTAGSQAPFLYEINALVSLPCANELPGPLPEHFPKSWLNFYDRRDFLSYKAEGVFQGPMIKDVRVDNGQPFPQAHSGYWENEEVWKAFREVLP
jgi:hypothetical protein